MAFSDLIANTTISGFSDPDRNLIIDVLQAIYNGSATARSMFDNWIDSGQPLEINYVPGVFQAKVLDGPFGSEGTGIIEIDLSQLEDLYFVDSNGDTFEVLPEMAIAHEFVHAIEGLLDVDSDDLGNDYAGDTVNFTNIIHSELGFPDRNSYLGASTVSTLIPNYSYTNGTAIDRVVVVDSFIFPGGNFNSSGTLGLFAADDLLIGDSNANILEAGLGNDFLFGGSGDDYLNGGLFGTDTAVLTGDPIDYDIRLNSDGTWTSRHVRGSMDEGADTFKNMEKVQFSGGQTFDLSKGGLTYQSDFAIVVDQTGSMGDDIAAVKTSATAIVDALFAGGTVDARIGIVGFRDNTIGEPTSVILPFTDQDDLSARESAAISAINSISVGGGGDFPETAFDGLLTALDGTMGEWREGAGSKKIVLFTDATAKDAFLLPTVLAYASDVGAVITSSSTASIGAVGAVDTFVLSSATSDVAALTPTTEGDVFPPYIPSGDPIQAPEGTATVEIYTIFVDTFTSPDPNLTDISNSTGGAVLGAATPQEVVDLLIDVISGNNNSPVAVDDTFIVDEDDVLAGNVLDDNGNGIDSDPDGDTLTVSLIDGPSEGSLILNDDGSFTYEADADAFDLAAPGEVIDQTFTYQIDDGNGETDQATVTISVSIQDDGETIIGTNKKDTLNGTDGGEDIIYGNNAKDMIYGLDGADTIYGGNADDMLFGGESADSLFGERGDDQLYGEQGEDYLDGGRGNDVLRGGLDDDTLLGGRGDDVFVFALGEGTDTILDYGVGEDLIGLVGLTFEDLTVAQSGDDATISAYGEDLAVLIGVDALTLDDGDFFNFV